MKKRRPFLVVFTTLLLSFLTVLGVSAQTLTEAGKNLERYDVNKDGKITIGDVTTLLDYLATGCGHEEVVLPGKEATCFQDGLTDGSVCASCGETLKEQQVIPAGHDYNEEGVCLGCGLSKTAVLDEHGFSYTLSPDGSYYILSSVGRNKDAVATIPAKYNGLPVTAIGIGAFYECSHLEKIILPESISAIGSLAFYGCGALKTVDLPEGVVYIGYSAFQDCLSLESISIPVGVTDILDKTFENCKGLTELTLHSFVETVGKRAFYGCAGLTSVKVGAGVCSFGEEAFGGCVALNKVMINDVAGWCETDFATYDANPLYYANNLYLKDELLTALVLPEGVTGVSAHAFRNASSITSLSLPESISFIGAHAFSGCGALETATFPEGLCRIEASAFAFCTALTRVTLPDTLTFLGDRAFYYCTSVKRAYLPVILDEIGARCFAECRAMTRLYLPDRTRKIGDGAFLGCVSLSDLTLPEGLEEIGKEAFYGCTALESVFVYDGLSLVGADAFLGCDAIEEVEIETMAGWCAIDFATASANPLTVAGVLIADGETIGDPVIPRGVEEIGSYAFYGFPAESITFPKGLVRIGAHAFEGCANVRELTLQRGLQSVGDYAFADCTALADISLPNGLTSLGKGAFARCSALEAAALPLGLTEISEDTFAFCTALTAAELPDGILKIGEKAFYQCQALEEIALPRGLSSIGKKAFYGCVAISSVTLPDGLATVSDDAYYGCSGPTAVYITDLSAYCEIVFGTLYSNPLYYGGTLYLDGVKVTELTIPEDTIFVGDYAFAGYTALKTVTLPTSLLRVGNSAFMDCSAISSIVLYDNVTKIGAHAFAGCTALNQLRLSSNLTEIGGYAFEGCARITGISLPEGLLTIGNGAFSGCTAMTLSALPKTLESIGNGAFAGCKLTAQLIIPQNVKLLGEGTFADCTALTDLLCAFEEKPIGWSENWNGGNAAVHWLPYWSNDGGTTVIHTPVIDAGYPATCLKDGLSQGVHCADCGLVLKAQEILPALGGEHEYAEGVCSRCGAEEPFSWTLEDGLLTVWGKGSVTAENEEAYPWYAQRSEITEIIVTGDITEIGAFAFSGLENVTKITLGDKVTVIGQDAFSYNYALKELVFGAPVTSVGQGSVYLCTALEKVTLTNQTKSAFLAIATASAYNTAFEEVTDWTADSETVGLTDLIVKGDSWEYVVYEESTSGLTATAPSGWLDGTDGATWLTGTAPLGPNVFGYTYFSAYLRKTFTIENVSALRELTLSVIYDENPAIYLNGQLLWSAEGYFDSGYVTVNLNDKLSLLKEGENILCMTFSNVYGGSTFDMGVTCNDEISLVDEDGYVVSSGAASAGFVSYGSVNDPANVLDNNPDTVCGSGWDASTEQSITVTFKGAVMVNSVYLQCKNEGTTTHTDGITRGSYDIYLINGENETKINTEDVLARTFEDGGATVTLAEGMEATGIKIVITSWQGSAWACLADVLVKGEMIV